MPTSCGSTRSARGSRRWRASRTASSISRSVPSLGGPEEPLAATEAMQINGVVGALDVLDEQLADRSRQLTVLEDLLLNRKLRDEVHPEGRPVTAGYVSSQFGSRTDPFTGRRAFHKGVDFAGREGAEVVAVASGVVIWSGRALRLRPARRGQPRQRLRHALCAQRRQPRRRRRHRAPRPGHRAHGRHGPRDGPNLHFEVLLNDKPVDPLTYVGQ